MALMLVVHLVRRENGPAALERFLDSYVAQPPGAEHQLLLALKGFGSPAEAAPSLVAARSRGLEVERLMLPDDGLDVTAYMRVVATVTATRYCFVNSWSRVRTAGWLAALEAALDRPGIGLAGATGSWASHREYRRYQVGLASSYDEVFEDRERTRQGFLALSRAREPTVRDRGRLAARAGTLGELIRDRGAYARFPSAHLRTNVFAAPRELLLELRAPRIRGKSDAYRFESGVDSITSQARRLGGASVVVAIGATYEPDRWDQSMTFWQGAQQNLIVSDNQTDAYEQAPPGLRRLLSQLAWGSRAQPE